MAYATQTREGNSLVGLISGLREDVRNLFHEEIQLAKTEISEKAALASRNAVYLAAGAVVALLGATLLLVALSFLASVGFQALGFSAGMALFLGFLVIAIVAAAVGGILINKAISAFKKHSLVPEKTIETLKEIKEGGLEQVPIKRYQPKSISNDNRTSEQIRSDVEQTRSRIGREVRGIRTQLSLGRLATIAANRVVNNPMRTFSIGLGTGLAGYVLMRVARLFGRRHAA
jgi:hypothetical protein